jgi:ribosomal protein S18 acetylase RimI-like enzyme
VSDPVTLCAEAYAGWHASWLAALGVRCERANGVWRALDRPPYIYLAGITLRPDVPAEAVASVPGSVGDVWQTLELEPYGFRVWRKEPWFYRAAAPLVDASPSELELVRVRTPDEVVELEAVSVQGFGSEEDSIEPGTFHPPSILENDAMHMFIGRVNGRAVGAAMGYVLDDAVGVFGVAVVASARRRGYGTALTRAAMLTETGFPAILAPSEEGASMYRRMGFEPVGELTIWAKASPDEAG